MSKLLTILFCALLALSPQSVASENTELQMSYILGSIDYQATKDVCSLAPNSTIVINSNGGMMREAYNIGMCIKRKGIKVEIVKALSAAPYVSMFSDHICVYEGGKVGIHTPYIKQGEDLTLPEVREIMAITVNTLIQDANIDPYMALSYTGFMLLIPSDTIGYLSIASFSKMVGDKYKGVCE